MIKLIFFGAFKDSAMEKISNDYFQRIKKYHKIEMIELKESTHKSVPENLKKEAEEIEKHIKKGSYVITLSPEGKQLDSNQFSELIEEKRNHHSEIVFITGSSNGIDNKIKDASHKVISFSKLTFPHLLFRIILLEQIYRAMKILNNERYHK